MKYATISKACWQCRAVKPLAEYYAHKQMQDGHLNKCKECVRARVRKHRLENLGRIQRYDRNRPNADERRVEANIRNKVRGYGKGNKRGRDPLKDRAHDIVSNAVRDGRLAVKPCERCGYTFGVNAHHEDYAKPLDVIWLCRPCHGQRHREINEERRRAA